MKTAIVLLFLSLSWESGFAFMPRDVKKTERPEFRKIEEKGFDTYAKVFSEQGVLKVNMRGCGSRAVFPNKKNLMPKEGDQIEIKSSRCTIVDWRESK